MTPLLPCPFCGSANIRYLAEDYVYDDLRARPVVECLSCDAWVPANVWNTRTAPANCKPSRCCEGELLVPLHSTNTKLCTGCKTEQPWPLEPGQKRTYE